MIPIVLCIDVEPDPRHVDLLRPPAWQGFIDTVSILDRARAALTQSTGSEPTFSWFLRMDPEIRLAYGSASWVVGAHEIALAGLRAAGDHFGLHVHTNRWDGVQAQWIIDYADPSWIDECLSEGFSAFRSSLGEQCRLFRFGDHWMDQRTFEGIAAAGVEIDLTLEPGHDDSSFYPASEPYTGLLPDYRQVPRAPYRPSSRDYRTADPGRHAGIWELPVTTADVQPTLAHRAYRRWITRRRSTSATTALVSLRPELFGRIVDVALQRSEPHLVLTLRSGAAIERRYAARIEANLLSLLTRREANRFRWVPPASAIQLLTKQNASSAAAAHPPAAIGIA